MSQPSSSEVIACLSKRVFHAVHLQDQGGSEDCRITHEVKARGLSSLSSNSLGHDAGNSNGLCTQSTLRGYQQALLDASAQHGTASAAGGQGTAGGLLSILQQAARQVLYH